MHSRIFCLILNFRHYQQSLDCINSLRKSDLPKSTTFVLIDNTPKPDQQFLKQFRLLPKTIIIKSSRNLGFAAGNNQGIKLALRKKASHILIINPDVTVPKVFFAPLLSSLNSDKKLGLVAPAIKHYQNGHLRYGLEGILNTKLGKATHVNLPSPPPTNIRPALFVTFACVLLKSSVFKKVGLLDKRYFMYLEDVDFCLSARAKGITAAINPAVTVTHQTSSSFSNPVAKLPLSFSSQVKFINKWINHPHKVFAIFYNLALYIYLLLLWEYQFLKAKLK